MTQEPNLSASQDPMIVDGVPAAPHVCEPAALQGSQNSISSKQSNSTGKKRVTVEDSMEVISELIAEIQSSDTPPSSRRPTIPQDHPKPPSRQACRIRISLAQKSNSGNSSLTFLPLLQKFFHALLSTSSTIILPVRNDSKADPLKLSSQINELTVIGAKTFLKANQPNKGSAAGDFHVSTTLSFEELRDHPKISNWLMLYGYFLVLSECQSSDMVKIGFLSRVRPFTWRDDLRSSIKESLEWQESPFNFRMFFGSISCNKRSSMAPVLMVEVEREHISTGLNFFCNVFDGDTPLSPCGIPYLFLTLYQNTLTDSERLKIINDTNHYIGYTQLVRLYGLKDIDTPITLQQNVTIKLRKLLLNLRDPHSSKRLFCQVEKEADKEAILCAFDSDLYELVMANLQHISLFIRQCAKESDWANIFCNDDFSLLAPQKIISPKGRFSTLKTIPLVIQEHTSLAMTKMMKVEKRTSVSSVSSFGNVSTSTSVKSSQPTVSTDSISSTVTSPPAAIEKRFSEIESKMNSSASRIDSIENLCRQLKSNTDIISQNIQQLASDFYSSRPSNVGCRSPASKTQRLSVD
jgi:hypothetical protein